MSRTQFPCHQSFLPHSGAYLTSNNPNKSPPQPRPRKSSTNNQPLLWQTPKVRGQQSVSFLVSNKCKHVHPKIPQFSPQFVTLVPPLFSYCSQVTLLSLKWFKSILSICISLVKKNFMHKPDNWWVCVCYIYVHVSIAWIVSSHPHGPRMRSCISQDEQILAKASFHRLSTAAIWIEWW